MTAKQLRNLDAMLRAAPSGEPSITDRRAAHEQIMAITPVPADVVSTPSTLGGRSALTLQPGTQRGGALIFLHGGGYVLGSPAAGGGLAGQLASRTGLTTYVPDYRLAPEDRFPAAVQDSLAAYRDVIAATGESPVYLAGESAGGGLSLAVALTARDQGLAKPTALALFSPWTDLTLSGDSFSTRESADPIFDRAAIEKFALDYLSAGDAGDPQASPLFADLTGLPPLLIHVGGNEVLLDDSVRLATKAIAAGVEVTLDVLPGAPHVYQMYVESLTEATLALDRAAEFLLRTR